MTAPVWKTPKGSLGTIQEQEFYELTLVAVVPDDPQPSLKFKIIAGALPPGIMLDETRGTIGGRPKDIYRFRGVAFDVAEDVTSTFCCRVTNTKTGQVADRTFKLTVTGQDAPTIVTEAKELGLMLDGTYGEFQITAIDLDREPLTYYITKGVLPKGMSLNKSTGFISGVAEPNPTIEAITQVGWSTESGWDVEPWDFTAKNVSKRFEFEVAVTDTKDTVSNKYSIYVVSKDSLTADNDMITVSGYFDSVITADLDQKRIPLITTQTRDLGFVTHDNYYAFKFEAVDFDGDEIGYSILIGSNIGFDNEVNGFDSTMFDMGSFALPAELELSEETGWLHGYITSIASVQREYEFGVYVFKRNYPEYKSKVYVFKITLVGDLRYVVRWISPTNLGTIIAGAVSELAIEADNALGKKLTYALLSGSKSRLPQGLRLLDNGLIVGRASFEVTTFDENTLSFDKFTRIVGSVPVETTLDRQYTFTVRATDTDGIISAIKTFTVLVKSEYNRPYESLYLRANPGQADKDLYGQVVYNTDIIPNEYVYRNGDPFFGKQKSLDVLVISGLNPSTPSEYIRAMAINHYRKKLLIGEPQIAQALDDNGNVIYEVLYLPIKDNSSQTKMIDLTLKIDRNVRVDNTEPNVDLNYFRVSNYDKPIYPNSLKNMRSQIKAEIGYVDREVLPTWMTSKQKDGKIPYWTPALVMAYLKPGYGAKVKFLFNRLFEYDLKEISFDVDRYIWDTNLTSVYDSNIDKYYNSRLTTYDSVANLGTDVIKFAFEGNGETTIFDLTLDADVGNDAVVLFSLYIFGPVNVGFTVAGVDSDATADITFRDSAGNVKNVTGLSNGSFTTNLDTFVSGSVTASIFVTDAVGNTAYGVSDTAVLDADVNGGEVSITLATIDDATAVEYVVTGIDTDATATVTFSDTNSNIVVNSLTNGTYTVNLSTFADGIITAGITATDVFANTATGIGDTALLSTVNCITCSALATEGMPVIDTIQATGVAVDGNTYVGKNYSCVDWQQNELHQFFYVGDYTFQCITLDATTLVEKRRATSGDIRSLVVGGRWPTSPMDNIDRLVKCPGTDWIFLSYWDYDSANDSYGGNTYITFNTVTGAMNYYNQMTYPQSLDYYDGPAGTMTSNGWHAGKAYWAMPLGTNSGKTLACSQLTDDGWGDSIDRAGYGLFIIDNTSGAINCIAYGDFGALKSWVGAYAESYSGGSTPTVVGSDYSEFVYYAPLWRPGAPEDKWGDTTWVTNNVPYDNRNSYSSYVYKVRVTTSGVITWDLVTKIEDPSVPDPSTLGLALNQSGYITAPKIQSGETSSSVIVFNEVTNNVMIVAPMVRARWYQYNGYMDEDTYSYTDEVAIFKISLTTNQYTLTKTLARIDDLITGAWNVYGNVPYATVNKTSGKIVVARGGSTTGNMDTGVVTSALEPTHTYILNCEDGTVESWIPDTTVGQSASYWYDYSSIARYGFTDVSNCRLIFIDWFYDNYPTVPYGQTELIQYVEGPKKEIQKTYIAAKLIWSDITPETHTAVTQNVCATPGLVSAADSLGITSIKSTSAVLSTSIDPNEVYIYNESLGWVKDTNNTVTYNNSYSVSAPSYLLAPDYYGQGYLFTQRRFKAFGYEMEQTVPGSSQKFLTGAPSFGYKYAGVNNSVCLYNYDTNTIESQATLRAPYGSNEFSQNITNASNTLNIQINGTTAKLIGSAVEPTQTFTDDVTGKFLAPQYAWVLLEVDEVTAQNAPCELPGSAPSPVTPTVPTPPAGAQPVYAVINVSSLTGQNIETMVNFTDYDYYRFPDYQPVSNYVGQNSASFGNTNGDGIYINGTLVGRWGGNGTNSRETIYIDVQALKNVTTPQSAYSHYAYLEIRANYVNPTSDYELYVDARTYYGGTIDSNTLRPTTPGVAKYIQTVKAPCTTIDSGPVLGDLICRIRIDFPYGGLLPTTALIAARTVSLNNATITQTGEGCQFQAEIFALDPAYNWTSIYTQSSRLNLNTNGYYQYNNDVGNTQPSNTLYHLVNGAWTLPPYSYYDTDRMMFFNGADGQPWYGGITSNLVSYPNWTYTSFGTNQGWESKYVRFLPVTGSNVDQNIVGIPNNAGKTFKKYSENGLRAELLAYPITSAPQCYGDPNAFAYIFFQSADKVAHYGDWTVVPGAEADLKDFFPAGPITYGFKRRCKIFGVHQIDSTPVSEHSGTATAFPRQMWLLMQVDPQ